MAPRSNPCIRSTHSPQNTFITVADRIAHFETLCHNPILPPLGSILNKAASSQDFIEEEKEQHCNDTFVNLFLQAIGQGTTSTTTVKIRSIALVWWEIVQSNLVSQKEENGSLGALLSSFDLMTASLDPKCAMLEVEGMEELSHYG